MEHTGSRTFSSMDCTSQESSCSSYLTPVPVRETQHDLYDGAQVEPNEFEDSLNISSNNDHDEGGQQLGGFSEHDVDVLIRVLKSRNIRIDDQAGRLLLQEAWKDGDLNNQIIDEFYAKVIGGIKRANECHSSRSTSPSTRRTISSEQVSGVLAQIKADAENIPIIDLKPTKILNVFHDAQREIWDFQQQKLVIDHVCPTLLPDPFDFQSAAAQRYHRSIQRLKGCQAIRWWSEGSSVAPTLTEQQKVVRPVECAMGVRGHQSIVGVLRREDQQIIQQSGFIPSSNPMDIKIISSTGVKWYLADTLQRIELDFTQCSITQCGLFLDSNVVIVDGHINQDSKLVVIDITHPPYENADSESLDHTYTDASVLPSSALSPSLDHRLQLRQMLLASRTLSGMQQPKDIWIVFGRCHLDVPQVLTHLFNALSAESNFSGIILTGEFLSKPYHDSLQVSFKEGFHDLFETLKLCERRLRGKRVVLIPSLLDPGLQFTPKLPLESKLIEVDNYPDFCEIILTSNPARFQSRQAVPSHDRTRTQSLITNMVVCRHDLIYDSMSLGLAVQSPFEVPSFPKRKELEKHIPVLLSGQYHLYPIPFCDDRGSLRIPPGFDFTLYLSTVFPDAIIVSDTVPFSTFWKNRCWFGSPGSISRGQYLVYDTCSNVMEIKSVEAQQLE